MAARKPTFRRSLREDRLASNAAQSWYASMLPVDDPRRAEQEERLATERAQIAPKRVRAARRPSGKPLERNVLKAIVAALKKHPKVASVERNQSGVFREGERYIRVGSKGKLDLTVYLRDGRYAEIEVKRPKGAVSDAQWKRIYDIRAKGGVAGLAHNVEEAVAIVEAA